MFSKNEVESAALETRITSGTSWQNSLIEDSLLQLVIETLQSLRNNTLSESEMHGVQSPGLMLMGIFD